MTESIDAQDFLNGASRAVSDTPMPIYDSRTRHRRGMGASLRYDRPYPVTSCYRPTAARGALRRQELSSSILDNAHGFPYLRKLQAHTSCINALAFSSGSGQFLASGGDDLRILLWNFYQDDVKEPSCTLRGPKGNIFCLEFSASNRYLISAGTDEKIYKFDIAHLATPIANTTHMSPDRVYRDHKDIIRAVTCHPTQDDLFMTGGEDGCIIRHDGRQSTRTANVQDTIQTDKEVTGVQYHPTMEHLFVTSDGIGRVFLRDARMAFGPLTRRGREGIVQRYNTKLTRKPTTSLCNPEASSVVFDRQGTKLAVTFMDYLPTIYSVSDPNPIAILSGKRLPDGSPIPSEERTYSNSCTVKHGAFGGPGLDTDGMYAGGSDDFRGYVWKIPPIQWLTAQREEYSVKAWDSYESDSTIAFTEGRQASKYIPVELSTPFCRLTGYNSIVNSCVFHPHLLHVVTAGVERNVCLHSPTPSSPCTQNLERAETAVRPLQEVDEDYDAYFSSLWERNQHGNGVDVEERRTLRMFDFIVQEQDVGDIFYQRQWDSSDSSDDDFPLEEDSD